MANDNRRSGGSGEVQLEGWALVAVVAALLALLVGAFYLGRWVERRQMGTEGAALGPPAGAFSEPATADTPPEAEVQVTYFDTVEGGQKEEEPQRQAAAPAPATPPAPPEAAGTKPEGPDGAWFVQVFAGRQEASARKVIEELKRRGYPVSLETETEGGGTLYRVRVGGLPDEAEARRTARRLEEEGFSTWVLRDSDLGT